MNWLSLDLSKPWGCEFILLYHSLLSVMFPFLYVFLCVHFHFLALCCCRQREPKLGVAESVRSNAHILLSASKSNAELVEDYCMCTLNL